MKKIILFLLLATMFACGPKVGDLEKVVASAIQEHFEDKGFDIKVNRVTLVKKSRGNYVGTVYVTRYLFNQSAKGEIPVDVVTDGKKFYWTIKYY